MNRMVVKIAGVVGLFLGVFLITQATERLRADPPPSSPPCPHETTSAATKTCVAEHSCENDNGNINDCLAGSKSHWEAQKNWPSKCVSQKDKLCEMPSRQCQTYIDCVYNVDTDLCTKALVQPNPPQTKEELKLVPGDCPTEVRLSLPVKQSENQRAMNAPHYRAHGSLTKLLKFGNRHFPIRREQGHQDLDLLP